MTQNGVVVSLAEVKKRKVIVLYRKFYGNINENARKATKKDVARSSESTKITVR
jgi:hypothetical protein